MKATSTCAPVLAPLMEITGTYGLPFVGAFLDRFEYFGGIDKFFERCVKKHKSTVFKVNMLTLLIFADSPSHIITIITPVRNIKY